MINRAVFAIALLGLLFVCPQLVFAQELSNDFERDFLQGLNFITTNKYANASEKFAELKSKAAQRGYENLPSFSLTLMERAESFLEAGENEKAAFLMRRAGELSPNDARVSFGMARFPEVVGYGSAASALLSALWLSLDSPVVLSAILANSLMLGLAGMTIALTVMCIVQITRRREYVFNCVYRALPNSSKGILGPPLVLALIVLPVFGGVLFALTAWSLLLAKAVRPARTLGLMTGLTVIVWGLSLPILSVLLENAGGKLAWVLEGQRLRSYNPDAGTFISEAKRTNNDPLLAFGSAQAAHDAGRYADARGEYSKLLETVGKGSGLGRVIRFHLATLDYREGNYVLAREQLVKLDSEIGSPFESAYNLSLIYLAELDTEGQRKYYEAAREIDPVRLARVERDAKDNPSPLLVGAPRSEFANFLLRPHILAGRPPSISPQRVSAGLCVGSTPTFLVILGVCTLIIAATSRSGEVPLSDGGVRAQKFLWQIVPGGLSLSGVRPLRGGVVFALFVSFVLAAIETPVRLIPITSLSRNMSSWFLVIVVLMLCGTWLLSTFSRTNSSEEY